MNKPFLTYKQQVEKLIQKGLCIQNEAYAKKILQKENYYNLVNGYMNLFIENQTNEIDIFKFGTKFEEIVALYQFDNELKVLFLDNILRIENTIKSEIAYHFSEKYGNDNYLIRSNFSNFPSFTEAVVKLISKIHFDISKQFNHRSIKHYLTKHGYVPMWVLVNILPIGRISLFYELMKQEDRQHISKEYFLMDHELIKFLKLLTLFRNCAAHDEIFYNFRTRDGIKSNQYHQKLKIKHIAGSPNQGKQDLFAILIAFKYLLEQNKFEYVVMQIEKYLSRLDKSLESITTNEVLVEMGFPTNWKEII